MLVLAIFKRSTSVADQPPWGAFECLYRWRSSPRTCATFFFFCLSEASRGDSTMTTVWREFSVASPSARNSGVHWKRCSLSRHQTREPCPAHRKCPAGWASSKRNTSVWNIRRLSCSVQTNLYSVFSCGVSIIRWVEECLLLLLVACDSIVRHRNAIFLHQSWNIVESGRSVLVPSFQLIIPMINFYYFFSCFSISSLITRECLSRSPSPLSVAKYSWFILRLLLEGDYDANLFLSAKESVVDWFAVHLARCFCSKIVRVSYLRF